MLPPFHLNKNFTRSATMMIQERELLSMIKTCETKHVSRQTASINLCDGEAQPIMTIT